ncbi:unnamed protein product [Didymodactylos carnosus]|uniref:Uncharacterized protein n=1 Tax=Didymodactylos carnosus TaxID=1234261 RepID=A0A813S1X1_9BILA|nr:unnamed protein product [Didymodactylos carnosus]CAF0791044.1 unnamed protein product [Didymodactylos carnosus]CAF3500938.1 unnamed protein product [Didymodactylos carnosus]CAF3575266.1 unnamed protein product [Didymodactylos carnosus]
MSGVDQAMLDKMVNLYDKKMTNGRSNGTSTINTNPSLYTPLSTLSTLTMKTGFESINTAPSQITRNNFNYQLVADPMNLPNDILSGTDGAYINALFDDPSRYHLNDTVLAGGTVRQQSLDSSTFQYHQPRIEKVLKPDILRFTDDTNLEEYENDEDHLMRYPDVKPYLEVISGRNFNLPDVGMMTQPSEEVRRLLQKGKLKNLYGYIDYQYNYIEPPWHFDSNDERRGIVNHNPPPAAITINDLQHTDTDISYSHTLPQSIPNNVVHNERYDWAPLPTLLYENFVPLLPTRRLIFRRDMHARDFAFHTQNPRLYSNSTTTNSMIDYYGQPSPRIHSNFENIPFDMDGCRC